MWARVLGGAIAVLAWTGPSVVAPAIAADPYSSGCPEAARMIDVRAGTFWRGSDTAERRLALDLSSEAVREARWFDAEWPRERLTLRFAPA